MKDSENYNMDVLSKRSFIKKAGLILSLLLITTSCEIYTPKYTKEKNTKNTNDTIEIKNKIENNKSKEDYKTSKGDKTSNNDSSTIITTSTTTNIKSKSNVPNIRINSSNSTKINTSKVSNSSNSTTQVSGVKKLSSNTNDKYNSNTKINTKSNSVSNTNSNTIMNVEPKNSINRSNTVLTNGSITTKDVKTNTNDSKGSNTLNKSSTKINNSSNTSNTSNVGESVNLSNSSNLSKPSKEKVEADKWKGIIYPNYKIEGIDVGGLTKEEAIEKVNKEFLAILKSKKINYEVDEIKQEIVLEEIEPTIDENIFDEAISYGKDLGEKEQYDLIKKGTNKNIKDVVTYNEEYINDLSIKYSQRVKNDSISKVAEFNDGKVTIKKGAKEKVFDDAFFKKLVKENINLNEEEKKVVKIPIKEIPTTLKDSDVSSINTEMSSYTTDYSWSHEGRLNNVEVATDKIQDTLIMPGAEFSFNRTVGPTDKAHGFMDSKVYIGAKTIDEPGGGVCQVATTLYNSVIMAGIDPTVRENHGMTIAYAPLGLDATVYDPILDFKFKNTYDKPILIRTYHDGASLTFSIHGNDKILNGVSYRFESEVTNHDPSKSKTVEDPTLPIGYEKVETTPYDGYKVKVFKITVKDGKDIKRELYTENEYKRVDEITRIGTGDPSKVTIPKEEEN